MLQAVLQPGMSDNPAKFEEMWKSWEHQMDIYENLSSTKLDADVKISVVLRERSKSVDDLLTSQSIEGRDFPDFSILDAKIISELTKSISNQHFRGRVSVEEQRSDKHIFTRKADCFQDL